MMAIRTIVAALIATSVALLPAPGMVILPAPPDRAVMVDQPDMPCCPCCDTQNDHGSTICALTCMSVAAFVVPVTAIALLPYIGDRSAQSFAAEPLQEFLKAPPTHPPQL
jgi:hypothetical protein